MKNYIKMYHKHNPITNIHLVDCVWGIWGAWGHCEVPGDKKCGDGERKRERSKITEEDHGGSCSGTNEKTKTCKDKECPGR